MPRVAIVLALCVTSARMSTVPAGTTIALVLAALVGFAAVHLRASADALMFEGSRTAPAVMRVSKLLQNLTLALAVLALLDALRPI